MRGMSPWRSFRAGCRTPDPRSTLDETGPILVLRVALYQRFSSRGDADFADKFLFVMLYEFGANEERETGPKGK